MSDPRQTILVVEDTAVAREPLVRILQLEGYNAIGVTNGAEALDALGNYHPNLVLLDILMPVMNGLEFLSVIRSEPAWHDLPVVVLTALQDHEYSDQVRSLGVQGFILKAGFRVDELLSMVRQKIHAPLN